MNNYKNNKELKIRSYTIMDMILDPKKKKEADNFYNKIYEEIEEDDMSKTFLNKIQNNALNNFKNNNEKENIYKYNDETYRAMNEQLEINELDFKTLELLYDNLNNKLKKIKEKQPESKVIIGMELTLQLIFDFMAEKTKQ